MVALYGASTNGTRNSISYLNLLDWQGQARSFEALAAWRSSSYLLTGRGDPELLAGQMVSANFFAVLRVQPLVGRAYVAAEDQSGAAAIAMLGEGLWRRRFGADPAVVGTSLTLNGRPHTVVGVVPAHGPSLGRRQRTRQRRVHPAGAGRRRAVSRPRGQ